MSKARFDEHVDRLLGPAPDDQAIRKELDGMVSRECAGLRRASPHDLEKEEAWLTRLREGARSRGQRAVNRVDAVARALADPETRASVTPEQYRETQSIMADAWLEMAVVAEINARVGECIEAQRRITQGEYVIQGKWMADCGTAPQRTGRITLAILPRGSVEGTVFPAEGNVGVEVEGPMTDRIRFALRSKKGRDSVVEVAGTIDSHYPLRGSGTIRLSGEASGGGRWECFGSWKSY